MFEFNFKNNTSDKISSLNLQKIANKFAQIFYPNENVQISTTIVTKKEIIKLNQKYFKKNRPTDVISLESLSQTEPLSLGEIIICSEVAREQAQQLHHSFEEEIEILFKHGLIHLLGKDHESLTDKKNWEKILTKLENKND